MNWEWGDGGCAFSSGSEDRHLAIRCAEARELALTPPARRTGWDRQPRGLHLQGQTKSLACGKKPLTPALPIAGGERGVNSLEEEEMQASPRLFGVRWALGQSRGWQSPVHL